GRVDLTAAVAPGLMQLRRRYPALSVLFESEVSPAVSADARALTGALTFLLAAVGHGARQQLRVRLAREGSSASCTLRRDGPAAGEEHLAWLEQPFATTQQALLGLALATARRVVEPAGGSVAASHPDDGGFCVRLLFPVMDP